MSSYHRVKRIELSPELVFQFLKPGATWSVLESDIPFDAEFRGVSHSPQNNTWNIFFSHPSFDEVPPYQEVPTVRPPTISRIELKNSIYEVVK